MYFALKDDNTDFQMYKLVCQYNPYTLHIPTNDVRI